MYKAAVRWMIRRNIARLNAGDYGPALAMFATTSSSRSPATTRGPASSGRCERGRQVHVTHRGPAEIERFLQRYVAAGIQMEVEDILVNGPPWNMRAAVRVHDWSRATAGDRYTNRAVLFVTSRWGKIRTQEDYEDTQRAAAFDALLSDHPPVAEHTSVPR